MSTLQERTLAGVTILDTPLIKKVLELARKHLNDVAYNHSVRSWPFGAFIADNIPSLRSHDREAFSVAAILHDLGWAITDEFIEG
jgi:HD superfamily phosphohydrolase YqeK